jgi:hypothetical protein
MSREAHLRFWEGVGVRSPPATRLPACLRNHSRSESGDRAMVHVLQRRTPASVSGLPDAAPFFCA